MVADFNESWADDLGYQLDLVGWEQAPPSFGRPQQIINASVDRCDLFLGLIWKRWGTPPSTTGDYTSGFEEEFERSFTRRQQTGSPEISLFFKDVTDASMEDPGTDLKKVIAFKEKLVAEKTLLFHEFTTPRDIERMARKCIEEYVRTAMRATASPTAGQVISSRIENIREHNEQQAYHSSPVSAEGCLFLERIVEHLRQEDALDQISLIDVARFRLLANSISKPGNHDMIVGAHDLNILFSAYVDGASLGNRELLCLARLGLQYITNENAPFWCWYAAILKSKPTTDVAILSTVANINEEETLGAFHVLSVMGREIRFDSDTLTRDWLVRRWFSDGSSSRVRSAALSYLKKYALASDLTLVKHEYEKNDQSTTRSAFECIVSILLRHGSTHEPQLLILKSQFASLDQGVLSEALDGFANLEASDLLIGLDHPNAQVRVRSMNVLLNIDALTYVTAERMCRDNDAIVRRHAITALTRLGRSFTDDGVRNILVWPEGRARPTLFGPNPSGDPDRAGQKLFDEYLSATLQARPEVELTTAVDASFIYDDSSYFARSEKYFSQHGDQLRHDVDNNFKEYFESRIQRMEVYYGKTGVAASTNTLRDIEGFHTEETDQKWTGRLGACLQAGRPP